MQRADLLRKQLDVELIPRRQPLRDHHCELHSWGPTLHLIAAAETLRHRDRQELAGLAQLGCQGQANLSRSPFP